MFTSSPRARSSRVWFCCLCAVVYFYRDILIVRRCCRCGVSYTLFEPFIVCASRGTGQTPLHASCQAGFVEGVRRLTKARASLNTQVSSSVLKTPQEGPI